MVALLPSCPVPGETLGQERGEPLFTRTAAKLIAVATAALTAVDQAPATVGALFRTARTVTLTGYRAANTVGFVPRRLVLAGGALTAAGVVLASQGSTLFGITGLVAALAGIYLVCFGVWSWLVILAVLVVVPVVATLVTRRVVPMAKDRTRRTSDSGLSAADGERGRAGGRRSRPNPERTLNVTARTVQGHDDLVRQLPRPDGHGAGRGAPGEEPGQRRGVEQPPAR
jgi:membrane protein implicated in regulation of membrane protease activity